MTAELELLPLAEASGGRRARPGRRPGLQEGQLVSAGSCGLEFDVGTRNEDVFHQDR